MLIHLERQFYDDRPGPWRTMPIAQLPYLRRLRDRWDRAYGSEALAIYTEEGEELT